MFLEYSCSKNLESLLLIVDRYFIGAPYLQSSGNVYFNRVSCVKVDRELSQGRLNQWAHWARAQGPRIFFLFEGPPTGCGEIFFKLIILLLMLLHDRTNTSSACLVNLT